MEESTRYRAGYRVNTTYEGSELYGSDSGSMETVLTTDRKDRCIPDASRQLDRLKRLNDELYAENHLISRQLYLAKHNTSLRVVSILAEVLNWIDNQGNSDYGQWNVSASPINADSPDFPASPTGQPVEHRGPGIFLRDLKSRNPHAGGSPSKEGHTFWVPLKDGDISVEKTVKETVIRSSTPLSEIERNSLKKRPVSKQRSQSLSRDKHKRKERSKTPEPSGPRNTSKSSTRRSKSPGAWKTPEPSGPRNTSKSSARRSKSPGSTPLSEIERNRLKKRPVSKQRSQSLSRYQHKRKERSKTPEPRGPRNTSKSSARRSKSPGAWKTPKASFQVSKQRGKRSKSSNRAQTSNRDKSRHFGEHRSHRAEQRLPREGPIREESISRREVNKAKKKDSPRGSSYHRKCTEQALPFTSSPRVAKSYVSAMRSPIPSDRKSKRQNTPPPTYSRTQSKSPTPAGRYNRPPERSRQRQQYPPSPINEVEPVNRGATRDSFMTSRKQKDVCDDGVQFTYRDDYSVTGSEQDFVNTHPSFSREFNVHRSEYRTSPSIGQEEQRDQTPEHSFRDHPPVARQLFKYKTSPPDLSPFDYGVQTAGLSSHFPPNNSSGNQSFRGNIDSLRRSVRSPRFTSNSATHNNKKIPTSKRLIGEIAFQLDRRILNYVFTSGLQPNNEDRRRFYGYIIRNIPDKIERESTNKLTGEVDLQKRSALLHRYNYILKTLQPLGYDIAVHAELCVDLVNKYGLLPSQPSRTKRDGLGPDVKHIICHVVQEVATADEREDVCMLLECLELIAKDDGKPMLMFS